MFKMGLFCLGHISSCSSECVYWGIMEVLALHSNRFQGIWSRTFITIMLFLSGRAHGRGSRTCMPVISHFPVTNYPEGCSH